MTPPSPLPPLTPTARSPPWARKLGRKGLLFDVTERPWGRSPQRRWTLGWGTWLNSALLLLGGAQAGERGAGGPPHWGYATSRPLRPCPRTPDPFLPPPTCTTLPRPPLLGPGFFIGTGRREVGPCQQGAGGCGQDLLRCLPAWCRGRCEGVPIRNHQPPSGGRWRATDPAHGGPSECGLLRLPRSRAPDPSRRRAPQLQRAAVWTAESDSRASHAGEAGAGRGAVPFLRSGSFCDLDGPPGCGAPACQGFRSLLHWESPERRALSQESPSQQHTPSQLSSPPKWLRAEGGQRE